MWLVSIPAVSFQATRGACIDAGLGLVRASRGKIRVRGRLWQGDGTNVQVFIRRCMPNGKIRLDGLAFVHTDDQNAHVDGKAVHVVFPMHHVDEKKTLVRPSALPIRGTIVHALNAVALTRNGIAHEKFLAESGPILPVDGDFRHVDEKFLRGDAAVFIVHGSIFFVRGRTRFVDADAARVDGAAFSDHVHVRNVPH